MFLSFCFHHVGNNIIFQAMCDLFAGARKSDAWATLICTLSQRLQFQGDNIKRIRVRLRNTAASKITSKTC